MDQHTLETVIRYGIAIGVPAVVGTVVALVRGRRGRKKLLGGLEARGARIAPEKSALQWPSSHAALAACGKITWSAHLSGVELGLYGGESGLRAAAVSWQSSHARGEWMLSSDPSITRSVNKLGWVERGTQVIGLLARASILVPDAATPPPAFRTELSIDIKKAIGPRREFCLHSQGGVLHLVISDPGELDEPLEYWVGASGAVDRALAM